MLKVIINFTIIFSAFGIKETPAAKPTADGSQLTKTVHTNENECSDSHDGITEAEHPGCNAGPSEEAEHPDSHDGHAEQSEFSRCCAPAEQTDLSGSNVPAKQAEHSGGHVHVSTKQTEGPGSYLPGEQNAQVERRDSRTPMALDDSGISIEGD